MSNLATEANIRPLLLVFGPQVSTLNVESLKRFSSERLPRHQWVLDTLTALPDEWEDFSQKTSTFSKSDCGKQLQQLKDWASGGVASTPVLPSTNSILSPLSVIGQLLEFWDFLDALLPNWPEDKVFPLSLISNLETIGLCAGTLSAFAVASSSTKNDLRVVGATAIRLAVLVGAFIDVDNAANGAENGARSFSLSWTSSESAAALKEILAQYPDVRIIAPASL